MDCSSPIYKKKQYSEGLKVLHLELLRKEKTYAHCCRIGGEKMKSGERKSLAKAFERLFIRCE